MLTQIQFCLDVLLSVKQLASQGNLGEDKTKYMYISHLSSDIFPLVYPF